jgi:hypothetical protein
MTSTKCAPPYSQILYYLFILEHELVITYPTQQNQMHARMYLSKHMDLLTHPQINTIYYP